VFSIKEEFDFSLLAPFEKVCDYFLFDTKGKLPGGNGYVFDWSVLKDYPSSKPYFLSGGIGLGNSEEITAFLNRPEAKYCHAIDVNSTFEVAPGLKKIEALKEFIEILSIEC
jgi:phosphoribosylanthranilate isomerase